LQEFFGLRLDAAKELRFRKNDGPREQREEQQDCQDDSRYPARLLDQSLNASLIEKRR
jgi:hypothetical protein